MGLGLALRSPTAVAWGPLGHRAIGAVADALLTPGARAEVARLLQDDRDRDGRPSGRTTLAEVSLWADEIRGTGLDRPAWHYDNMRVCGPVPPETDWCPRQQCATGQIGPLLAQLGDRTAPLAQRRDALKWIAHLVGDLHQPLHAADYAQGGNLVHVELAALPGTSPWTLHAAWDVRLVASALHAGSSQEPSESALRLLVARGRRLPPTLREAPVGQWLAESNRLAREVALDYPGFACGAAPQESVVLSVDYQRRAQRVIIGQLALAGARLATVLNRALAAP
ncbi:MAG TPA: S1/P1 nuclease [Burkholderiaceae bacterium]|jgi:hypothetical protein|nr:S1/P1 nuclease [Burkholderiaceae bacterium]